MTDPHGVCAGRAETLAADVAYVHGWREGQRGAAALAEQLRALGLELDFPGLRPDVNVEGEGLVHLGQVRPEAAELLTFLLVSGLTSEIAERVASEPGKSQPPAAPAA